MKPAKFSLLLLSIIAVALLGCSKDEPGITDTGGGVVANTVTCLGCHSSEENLKAALAVQQPALQYEPPLIATGDG